MVTTTGTATAVGKEPAATRLDPGLLKLAAVLILGMVAPLLDSTIVNVALRALGGDLHASVSTIQWVSTGYLLAMGVTVPITGWATERFGSRRVWLASVVLFGVGSVCAGAAWNVGSLVAFRVVQGVGAGIMLPLMQTLLFRRAGGRPMGGFVALVSLPAMVAPVLGPVVGGVLIQHLDWRWIFYVNPPICALAFVLAWRMLPADTPGRGHRLDVAGLSLVAPALAAIIFGLSEVGDAGGFGHARVLVPLVGGAVLLAAFVVHALRAPVPLIDLRLFRVRSFGVSAVLLFLSGLAVFSAMLLLPLYYQQLRGESVVRAGLLLVPQGIGMGLSRLAGGLIDRYGARPVVLGGTLLTALGTLPFAFAGAHTSEVALSAVLLVRGAGLGAVVMSLMLGAYADLTPEQVPHASSATRIMQQVGGSFGTAVLAVILQRQLAGHPGAAGQAVGFQHAFVCTLVFAALALVPALALPRRTESRRPGTGRTGTERPVPERTGTERV